MIHAKSICKQFGKGRAALHEVSFSVNQVEIVGLLGHNGAGKSTMVGILLGMVRPDSGEAQVAGYSVQRERSKALAQIGAIFEAPAFYDYMSGWHNLRSLCALSGWWDEKEVWRALEIVKLKERIHSKVRTYSHGMRQRLALAQALLPMPKVLLLDEPTDGLDPEGIHEFRSTVLQLREQHGLTILLNSHLLGEVEQMCDRCVILREGQKVYEGPVQSTAEETRRYAIQSPQLSQAIAQARSLGARVTDTGVAELPAQWAGPTFLKALVEAGVEIEGWTPLRKTLEDWYLELTKGAARVSERHKN